MLKLDPSNVELLKQKHDVLAESIKSAEEKLNKLKEAEAQVQEQFKKGDISKEQYRDFQREIISSEQKLKFLKEEMQNFGSVTEQQLLAASKKIKDMSGKFDEASKKISGLSLGATAALTSSTLIASSLEDAIAKYIATTGKATTETEKYSKILKNIHDSNYGEDYADIADKMRIVENILGNLSADNLENVVKKSYMLQDAYDIDFQEGIRAVDALMKQFGITADEAYELINQGAQKGLNQNKDLGDQVAEYAVHWKDLGFEVEDMFNALISGAKSGTFTIDFLNDAIKEMGIRVLEGTDNQKAAFAELGLNADLIIKKFGQGGSSAKEAFKEVSNALQNLEDPLKRNQIGIELFGTKFEDLGEDAVFAMFNAEESVKRTANTVEFTTKTMYGSTSKQAEQTMRSIKSSFASMSKSVLPIINKVAIQIEKWAKKFDGLSDGTKKTIVTLTSLVAVASPFLKLGSKAINGVGSMVSAFGKLSTALKIGKTATDAATKSQLANNAAVLANPYVLAAAALAGLTVALVAWSKKSVEASNAVKEEAEAVKETKKSWEELVESKNKSLNESLNEINYYEELVTELQTLVDANGKVKDGYEGRASFITSTLSNAFGLEIKMIDGVINNYKDLSSTMDEVINKKKASVILDNQEETYKTAISNRQDAVNKLKDYNKKIEDLRGQLLEQELIYHRADKNKDFGALIDANEKIKKIQANLKEYEKMYRTQSELVKEYAYNISTYESNMALFHEGKYSEMSTVNYDYLKSLNGNQTTKREILNSEIEDERKYLEELKKMKEQSGSSLYDMQINQAQKRIDQLQNDLKNEEDIIYNSLFNINSRTIEETDKLISLLDDKTISFQDLGNGYVQMYANGIAVGTPIARTEAENLVNNINAPLSVLNGEGEIAGKNLIYGLRNGLSNREIVSSIMNNVAGVGRQVLSVLKDALKEKSPSKASEEMGVFLDKGLEVGIDKQKGKTLNKISSFGKSVIKSLNSELGDGVDFNTSFSGTKNIMMKSLIDSTSVKSSDAVAKDTDLLTKLMDKYMPEIIKNMPKYVTMDGKIVGKLIAPEINRQLNDISMKEKRGY